MFYISMKYFINKIEDLCLIIIIIIIIIIIHLYSAISHSSIALNMKC
jgi:hypothetical protein